MDKRACTDKGGRAYDDYRRVIKKVKIDFLLTEEQAIASLEVVKGVDRHPYFLLMD